LIRAIEIHAIKIPPVDRNWNTVRALYLAGEAMKGLLTASCVLLLSGPLSAQTNSPYNLTVHVTGSQITYDCTGASSCSHAQILHVVIDGQPYQLEAHTLLPRGVISLGDYPARLASDEQKSTNEFTRAYTIQFPDHSTRTFDVIGVGQ
jgi:hypothetical protein